MAWWRRQTFTPQEVYADLKGDIMGRFDRTDKRLDDVSSALANTATRTDVRALHIRIDGVEHEFDGRLKPLEAKSEAAGAIAAWRSLLGRRTGWIVSAVAVPLTGILIGLLATH